MRRVNIAAGRGVLRAVEPEDLDLMYIWENDLSLWEFGDTHSPYSRHQLSQFIESQQGQGIDNGGQLRLIVTLLRDGEHLGGEAIGAVDIFDYDPFHHRAGIGILIDPAYRSNGYAQDAIIAIEEFMVANYELHQLWCNIAVDNTQSISLFKKCGYQQVGVKRDWRRRGGGYVDELLFQKIF